MKNAYYLLTLICSLIFGANFSLSSELNQYQKNIDTLLERTGAEDFINDIIFIKNHKDVTFADERMYSAQKYQKYWSFWQEFNIKKYEEELKNLIQINYSANKLIDLKNFFMKDFFTGVFKSVCFSSIFVTIYNGLLLGARDFIILTDERRIIVDDFYKYLGLSILEENLHSHMQNLGEASEKKYKVRDLINNKVIYIKANSLKEFSMNIRNQLYIFLVESLKVFSNNDLKYFLTQMKGSTNRSYIQMHVNFHYLFLFNAIIENEKSLGLIKLDNNL